MQAIQGSQASAVSEVPKLLWKAASQRPAARVELWPRIALRPLNNCLIFILTRMRMSHIYQPLMLMKLLGSRGKASTHDLGRSILERDVTQLEYYEAITREMPG